MKSTSAAFPPKEPRHLTAQRTILRIYELFVRTTYDDFEETSSMRLDVRDDNKTDSPSNTILDRIDELARATKQQGTNLLRDATKHLTQELSVRVLFIWKLLRLTAVTGGNSADYRTP